MSFKPELYQMCHHLLDERIARSEQLIKEAQKAANQESKSSVGDKYETGRAMMMLEREKGETQLLELLKLKKVLNQINPEKISEVCELGSLIHTTTGYFYLAISLGKITLNNKDIFVLSQVSPLGRFIEGKKKGDTFSFNSQSVEIKLVE